VDVDDIEVGVSALVFAVQQQGGEFGACVASVCAKSRGPVELLREVLTGQRGAAVGTR
jgi:hypothetical protein